MLSYATGMTHGPRKLPVFDLQRRFLSPIHSVAFVIFLFSPRIPERFRMLLQNPERGNGMGKIPSDMLYQQKGKVGLSTLAHDLVQALWN